MAIMEQATKEQDDEEWYPPSPPIYDVADKLIEINRSVGLRSFKFVLKKMLDKICIELEQLLLVAKRKSVINDPTKYLF